MPISLSYLFCSDSTLTRSPVSTILLYTISEVFPEESSKFYVRNAYADFQTHGFVWPARPKRSCRVHSPLSYQRKRQKRGRAKTWRRENFCGNACTVQPLLACRAGIVLLGYRDRCLP